MNRPLLLVLLLLGLLGPGLIRAEIQGDLRFMRSGEGIAWQGEQVPLYLELWSDGFSFAGQSFQLPEVPGGYLVTGDAGTTHLNERRGSETWQGLRYDLKFYPQRAGTLEIPSFKVRFSAAAGFGTEPEAFEFETTPLQIEVISPPGAAPGETLVSTTSFDLDYHWIPVPGEAGSLTLQVGDALELEVVRTATGIPGMMFEPLVFQPIEGLGVYPGKPEVTDRSNRGRINGRRVDRVTFVCEKAGDYALPGWSFQAWNPQTEQLTVESIPPLGLSVSVNPEYRSVEQGAADDAPATRLWWLVLGVLLITVLAIPVVRRFGGGRDEDSARALTEEQAYRQVLNACRKQPADRAYAAINDWLAVSGKENRTFLEWVRNSADDAALANCYCFERAVLSQSEWDRKALCRVVERLRSEWRGRSSAREYLPRLNPG